VFEAYWQHKTRKDKKALKYLKLVCGVCRVQFWFNYELRREEWMPENASPTKIKFFRAIQLRHQKLGKLFH